MESPATIKGRLKHLFPEAKQVMTIGGTPGAAIAIIDQGKLIHSEFIGYRDIEKQLPVDDATVFPCASLTKAVVSAAVALCVEDGKFTWDTPVKNILPEFHTRSEILHHHMTPVDCLSHRAGMQSSLYWLGSNNNVLIAKEKSLDFINDLRQVRPFRNEYLYNNLGYEIAAHILEKATDEPWEQILHKRIYQPLEMSRTGTDAYFDDGSNRATTYQALDDGSVTPVTPMLSGSNTVGGPGSAMRSCLSDLVKLYTCFLETFAHQQANNITTTPGSPLTQVPYLFSSKITMAPISPLETSYALGWARVQTPGPMGAIGLNPDLLSFTPTPQPNVARSHPSNLILYHQGSMPGNLAAVNIVPARKGAVIVLTNSLALNDTADWLGQLYLEGLLGVADRHDYVAWARESAGNALKWYPRLAAELEEGKTHGTQPRELRAYAGVYYNEPRTMMIKVFVDSGNDGGGSEPSLKFAFQGLDDEIFPLTHYHHDEFTWLLPRNEFAHRARFTNYNAEYFKIRFFGPEGEEQKEEDSNGTGEGQMMSFMWWHDRFMHEAESFMKSGE